MLLLFETSAGFGLFKVLDEGKIREEKDLGKYFSTSEGANKFVKLKAFSKFENTTDALAAATALVDSKLSKGLKKFLKKNVGEETLALADSKLGSIVKDKLGINCVANGSVLELARGVRSQLGALVSEFAGQDLSPMSLGLAHSLSRYKLKFSPEKVDTMIIQAIGLLDDLDKELNTYAMRAREWYGWHFPEMSKIVTDNVDYAKTVKLMGTRECAAKTDFSDILPEEVESELKDASIISMGTEINEMDMTNIIQLCDQVISLSEYRTQLFEYLKSRMNAIAPNLTVLVGELVGARLIAHAGSLINLAKHPASTVQILGAEKALFRALKTKHETPKYGLIYHASLIGQSAPKFKGKISRVLAAKCSLAIRVDALSDSPDATIGIENRAKVEARLRQLEGKALGALSARKTGTDPQKYDKFRSPETPGMVTTPRAYNVEGDVALETPKSTETKEKKEKKDKSEKKEKKDKSEKKEKKRKSRSEEDGTPKEKGSESEKKKKKREKKEG